MLAYILFFDMWFYNFKPWGTRPKKSGIKTNCKGVAQISQSNYYQFHIFSANFKALQLLILNPLTRPQMIWPIKNIVFLYSSTIAGRALKEITSTASFAAAISINYS